MENQIEKFTVEFFENLKCEISKDGDILIVENVPKSFEDLYGKTAPYRLSFSVQIGDADFVGRGGLLMTAITKFLKGTGKTTLLKIDFSVNPIKEIEKAVSFKNCEVGSLTKKYRNNFFSRLTFITTFQYLNESEQVVNEIYVHNGKVVNGDLSGYSVIEGENKEVDSDFIKKDYDVARGMLGKLLERKKAEISAILEERADREIEEIKKHYENLMEELGGDLNGTIKKVRKAELTLRGADEKEKSNLRMKLDKLRKGLIKIGDDNSRKRILKEQEWTIRDAIQKYSLNIDNKIVNTTVIYYPVFSFNLFLKGSSSKRFIKMNYDPLTKTLDKLTCESCGKEINCLNLCSAGHINCNDCLIKCGECGKIFCKKCLRRSCSVCGKLLCKNCAVMCLGCGKYVCGDHMRKDCVSGDDRCVSCLRACLRCHGLADAKYFSEALDGSKICQKCLGTEKRGEVMGKIFDG